jgi:hypothetical protein
MDQDRENFQKELDVKMGQVSGLLSAAALDIAAIRSALEFLKTSSNATFHGTIVFEAIQKFETAIENIEDKIARYEHDILDILKRRSDTPILSKIKITFTPNGKGAPMSAPVEGAVTLTTVGQLATASILGFDQFGNPWTGTIPPVNYAIDNPAIATSTPNADGVTDAVVAVANGTANLTASLTTAEGLALTDTEQVIVALTVAPPPPTPVLSSIKVAFSS